jgi:Xaa-Pro aminopeptidase
MRGASALLASRSRSTASEIRTVPSSIPAQFSALVGHSIGTWWHQQEPIFAQGATTPLEAGMVIALEPTVGEWITQDLFLVTNDGAQLLSDKFNTEEVYVIGAD